MLFRSVAHQCHPVTSLRCVWVISSIVQLSLWYEFRIIAMHVQLRCEPKNWYILYRIPFLSCLLSSFQGSPFLVFWLEIQSFNFPVLPFTSCKWVYLWGQTAGEYIEKKSNGDSPYIFRITFQLWEMSNPLPLGFRCLLAATAITAQMLSIHHRTVVLCLGLAWGSNGKES